MNDIIATEAQAKQIGGNSLSIEENKMCTQERAIALNCKDIGYASNRLIPYNSLVKAEKNQNLSINFYTGAEGIGVYSTWFANPGNLYLTGSTHYPLVNYEGDIINDTELVRTAVTGIARTDDYYLLGEYYQFNLTIKFTSSIASDVAVYLPMDANTWASNEQPSINGQRFIDENLIMYPKEVTNDQLIKSQVTFTINSDYPLSEISDLYICPARGIFHIQT